MRSCEKRDRNADQSDASFFRLHPAAKGYPSKTIPKNFVSLITYPHSESKRFEKPSAPEQL